MSRRHIISRTMVSSISNYSDSLLTGPRKYEIKIKKLKKNNSHLSKNVTYLSM